jgi:hypothetical protein
MVAGVAHVPASPTVNNSQFPPDPSPASHDSHPSHASQSPQSAIRNQQFRIPHSAFSPFVPDVHTLLQALKSSTLPPNCAGALFENPGEALVKALHQLHTIYFSLYPNQSPSPAQSPSQSPSSGNLQSGTPQPDAPSVNPVNTVNTVHSPSPAQSEISNLKSEIPNPQSAIYNLQSVNPHSTFRIPHSDAPP